MMRRGRWTRRWRVWEARRDRLYQTLVALGDFRRGTISVNYRRCGKPNCACARAEHPGHGPQYLWNATMGGKSRARNLRVGPELEKVGQEVETYRAFVRLCAELVEVNERICELRPMRVVDDAQELAAVKKKIAQAVRQEGAAEGARLVARVLADGQRRGALDLEASEMALRAAMHQVGGTVLAHLLNADRGGVREARIACGQGQEAALVDYRSKEVLTVLGPVSVQRAYYHCARCRSGVIPKDRALDILGTSFSPGVRRMMGRVGAKEAFATGRQDLEELAGIVVKTKAVERIAEALGQQIETAGQAARAAAVAGTLVPLTVVPTLYIAIDGTGVPMVPRETRGHPGKAAPGQAKTREAKLGCVFTQTRLDGRGRPVRDDASTTYVGAIEPAEAFGQRLYAEAVRPGGHAGGAGHRPRGRGALDLGAGGRTLPGGDPDRRPLPRP